MLGGFVTCQNKMKVKIVRREAELQLQYAL